MPSVIDSAKLVFTDQNAPLKILFLSTNPFIIYNVYNHNFSISDTLDIPIIILLSILLLGYTIQTLTNSLQEKNYILSSLNPFVSFWVGIKTILSCSIFLYLPYLVYTNLQPLLDLSLPGSIVLLTIAYLVASSFFFTSLIFYAKECNVFAGWNLIKIFKNFHEIIVYLAIIIISLAIFNVVTALPIGAAILGLFGKGYLFDYFICFVVTSNLLLLSQSLSHAFFEQIHE